MTEPGSGKFKILFLCTGNSARSIIAEYLVRKLAGDRFVSFSAGSHPKGAVHPLALEVLADYYGIDASAARSKSWDELRGERFDFVITVCDNARESCPYWPGQPVLAHWGTDDPAAWVGTPKGRLQAFRKAAAELYRRIDLFRNLPFSALTRLQLEQETTRIGRPGSALILASELANRSPEVRAIEEQFGSLPDEVEEPWSREREPDAPVR